MKHIGNTVTLGHNSACLCRLFLLLESLTRRNIDLRKQTRAAVASLSQRAFTVDIIDHLLMLLVLLINLLLEVLLFH